ncbi:MAG TPA: LPS export ABC transporter periplasmic protein LptC [Pseudolabrys sp.]|nr:LPS export ABC transporter periplasmic protein LptC [Pseudolabrys sp.]
MNGVAIDRVDPRAARASWSSGRRDNERAFRAAQRHSRTVRILRIAVPATVLAGVAIAFLAAYLNPLRMLSKLPINAGNVIVSGTKITMEAPRLSGFTRDARAYKLTAEKAAQDLTRPDIVELKNIHADVQMQDKSTMDMTAANGVYDTKNEMLTLSQNIVLTSSAGYKGLLSEAIVDIRKGNITSKRPVELELLQGTLNAEGLQVTESGDSIRFNDVRMVLMLDGSKPRAGKDKP